ncbi:DMT family transporter [Actinophytocola sp.]|uniref:DMT family transporter n=1 Tax=Actinophytocola sp. TaxID=1872138 RepID=UPI002D7E7BAD|nr:DMT family transporter [Actinophytocola sp.]HET9140671.1 DMT family transporter [Actinophytocola sp.]
MIALAITFAVSGAALSAVGVQLQAAGVRAESRESGLRLRGLARLTHNPTWLMGLAVLSLCAVLQILALALAPVTVVAPIVVLALPVSVVINARANGVRLDAAALLAVVTSTGGVVLFVALAAGAAKPVGFDRSAVLYATVIVAGAVLVLGVAGGMRRGIVRCVAFAAATGAAYGLVSVLVRDVTFSFQHGGLPAVSPLAMTALAFAFAAGSLLLQHAYSSGPPDVVVGCQTVLNPLVATALGIGLLDETVDAGGVRGLGLVAGALAAVIGVAMLARHHPDAMRQAGRVEPAQGPGQEPGGEPDTSVSASSTRKGIRPRA